MSGFVERVASEAVRVRPLKMLLTVLSWPFYFVGFLVGLLIVVFLFAVAAVKVGIADGRLKASPRNPAPVVEGG